MSARGATAHLMTRGTPRRLDYRFLGPGPARRWWAPLQDWVVLEQPEVLVRGGAVPGVLVSGIPSARRDVVGTTVRFTLVVDGAPPELLCGLAAAGLAPAGRARLGAELDAAFPAAWVDRALDGHPPGDDPGGDPAGGDEVAARLAPALAGLTAPGAATGAGTRAGSAGPRVAGSWVGSLRDERAVAAFLDHVRRLGTGTPGWAFTTTALTTVDGAREAAAAVGAPAAILIVDGGPAEVTPLGSAAGKAPAGRRTGPPRARLPPPRVVVLATVLVLAVLMAVLAVVLAVVLAAAVP